LGSTTGRGSIFAATIGSDHVLPWSPEICTATLPPRESLEFFRSWMRVKRLTSSPPTLSGRTTI
jgi:hypothetical protein